MDIRSLLEDVGSDRLPGAVPVLCRAGDVSICNRQAVHGSFANTTSDRRWSITYGFLPKRRVLSVVNRRLEGTPDSYDEARIRAQARMVPIAIDARRRHRPDEGSYEYQPLCNEKHTWNEAARYWLRTYHQLNVHL